MIPRSPRVRINVTKEAVTKAIEADSSRCWIAEAIKAQIPTASGVIVDLATTRFSDLDRGLRYVYLTPYSAQVALLSFDEGTPPEPFSFVLKNGHVTRSGQSTARRAKRKAAYETEKARVNAMRRDARKKARALQLQDARIVRANGSGETPPVRFGGRRPPQLRMLRQYGVRAFRGAALKRKAKIESETPAARA